MITGDDMRVIVIGAGPCGLMSAISIKRFHPNYQVILLEKDKDIGSRIKVSGNGRCNFINKNLLVDKYSSNFSQFVIKYQDEVMKIFDEEGLAYYFDNQGRAYPQSESSMTIIHLFKDLLKKYNIDLKVNYLVEKIEKIGKSYFINDELDADKIVVSIGGVSYLNDRLNFNKIINSLNVETTSLSPSLTPISVSSFPKNLENKKIKCEARLIYKNQIIFKEEGEVLFKKDGLSGIVIFNLSSYLARRHLNQFEDYQISLNILPKIDDETLKKMVIKNPSMNHILIQELAEYISTFSNKLASIRDLRFKIRGLYEFKNSQVTSGGVSLKEINENLSLKKDSNIFVGGEFIDIDGVCGGYNIGFALCAGFCIGKNI